MANPALKFPLADTDKKPRVNFRSFPWASAKPTLAAERSEEDKTIFPINQDITLSMPNNFVEDYVADWKDESVVLAGMGGDGNGSAGSTSAITTLRDLIDKVGLGTVGNTARYDKGYTNMPGKFLIFEEANAMVLNFSYDMIPHNIPEAERISAICDVFKHDLLPTYNGALLLFPDVWTIRFLNIKGPGFGQSGWYQGMALTGCKVTYLGGGSQSALTYHDASPVGVNLSLSFKSIKHMYNETDHVNGGEALATITGAVAGTIAIATGEFAVATKSLKYISKGSIVNGYIKGFGP